MLSSTITRTTAKAIFDAMYAHSPQGSVLPPSSVISPGTVAQTHVSFLGQSLFSLQMIGLHQVVRPMLRSQLQTQGGVLHSEVFPPALRLISRLLTPLVLLLHPKGHCQNTWLTPFLLFRVALEPRLSPTKMGDAVRLVLSSRLLTPHVWLSHP